VRHELADGYRSITVDGKGRRHPVGPDETTNFCFVDDSAEAFVRCCQYRGDRLPHDVYYIGGFKASIRELMEEVKKTFQKRKHAITENLSTISIG